MRIALFFVCFAALFCGIGWCQTPVAPPLQQMVSDPEAFATAHIRAMDQQLQLSDEQKAQIRPLLICEAAQLQMMLNKASTPDPHIQVRIARLHLETRNRIAVLLTPEQRERFVPPQFPSRTPPAAEEPKQQA